MDRPLHTLTPSQRHRAVGFFILLGMFGVLMMLHVAVAV